MRGCSKCGCVRERKRKRGEIERERERGCAVCVSVCGKWEEVEEETRQFLRNSRLN